MGRKPLLIVVAGPNGSGKTTLSELLIRHEWGKGCVYVNPDVIAKERFGTWDDLSSFRKAAEVAARLREKCLEERADLMFETVFSTEEKLRFVERALRVGYFVRFFFVCTKSPVINGARVTRRVMQGGHAVPIEKIVERYYRSLFFAGRVVSEVHRAYFFDNSVENAEPRLVFRSFDGQTKLYQSELPEWAALFYKWLGQRANTEEIRQDVRTFRLRQDDEFAL